MPRPTNPEPQIQFTIRLPEKHVEALRERAEREDRTASAEIRRLVRQYVEEPATKAA
jgi:predicted transcriptional regulator